MVVAMEAAAVANGQGARVANLRDVEFADLFLSERIFEVKGAAGKLGPIDLHERIENAEAVRTALLNACFDRKRQCNSGTEFALDYDGMRFRVAELQSRHNGAVFVLRRLPKEVPKLSALGLPSWVVERLTKPKLAGMVLVAGATGSGKTTTISALIVDRLKQDNGVCLTIEDPPEMPLEGLHGQGRCYQVEVHGGNFAAPCRQSLRMAPNYLFLGEIRDAESAIEALRASLSGHLVYATIHAYSAGGAVERLHSMTASIVGSDDAASMISQGLAAILHQEMLFTRMRPTLNVQMLWLHSGDMTGVRTQIGRKQFNMIDAEVRAQALKAKAGTLSP